MKIIRAKQMGMCTGVNRALKIAGAVKEPGQVTILGELVHNEYVNGQLAKKGFKSVDIDSDYFHTKNVLVTAHGISGKRLNEIKSSGKEVIDATCPLVRVLQIEAQRFRNCGIFTVVIGEKSHAEIKSITEDMHDYCVVSGAGQVADYHRERVGVICQTTSNRENVLRVLNQINVKNPKSSIEFVDTICPATQKRQDALKKLCSQSGLVLVIGSRSSNNTLKLLEVAEKTGVMVKLVQGQEELNPRWFIDVNRVGITAGASTPDVVIREVEERIREIQRSFRMLHRLMEERIHECMCGNDRRYL